MLVDGLDAISHDCSEFTGMIGSYGNRYSNLTLANCDCLLVLGSRLDSRQTGTKPNTFARGAIKIHVDVDEHELNAKVQVDYAIKSDLRVFLQYLSQELPATPSIDIKPGMKLLPTIRKSIRPLAKMRGRIRLTRIILCKSCRKSSLMAIRSRWMFIDGDTITLDVGQNQMWRPSPSI